MYTAFVLGASATLPHLFRRSCYRKPEVKNAVKNTAAADESFWLFLLCNFQHISTPAREPDAPIHRYFGVFFPILGHSRKFGRRPQLPFSDFLREGMRT